MNKIIKYVIIIILLFPVVVIGLFTYFSIFQNDMERSMAITRSDWMLMWGAILGYVGTVSLGVVALYQSNQSNAAAIAANQMTQNIIEMEHRERLAFACVESTHPLLFYLGKLDGKPLTSFEKEMNSTKTWINVEFLHDKIEEFDYKQTDNDYSLLIFNIKTLSSNHVKKIRVNSIVITSPAKDMDFSAKKVWTDCGQFLEFGNSYKVAMIVHGLVSIFGRKNLTAEEAMLPEFDLLLNVTVENLYGDTVTINWSMAAEGGSVLANNTSTDNSAYHYQLENIGFQVQEKRMSTIISASGNKKTNDLNYDTELFQ